MPLRPFATLPRIVARACPCPLWSAVDNLPSVVIQRFRQEWPLLIALLLAVPLLFGGLSWGLPSRESDPFLFGDRTPWTGKEILELAGGWSSSEAQGADVQRDAALDRSKTLALNETDVQRADIVRRYRLYTDQPDEMINLRAFSQMSPGQFRLDPRLYQYGGVWFYPAGIILKSASVARLVDLRSDLSFYLDHPDALGGIYVTLRAISAAWALTGLAAIYVLCRQIGSGRGLSGVFAFIFAAMPGVIVFSHEAKPHVTGVVLVLWAAVTGVEYVRGQKRSWLIASAVLAGLAFGVVVSMLPAVLVPLAAVLILRWRRGSPEAALVVGLFVLTYFLANPYVLLHLLTNRSMLFGQVGNSTAMYSAGSGGIVTGLVLLVLASPAVLLLPVVLAVCVTQKRWPLVFGVLGPCVVTVGGIFFALAAGKPGEYARFGLLVGAFSVVAAAALARSFARPLPLAVLVLALSLLLSAPEWWAYVTDARGNKTRLGDAQSLAGLALPSLAMEAEPAPYNTPPVDLWKTRLLLLPRTGTKLTAQEVGGTPRLVQPPKSDGFLRMSWCGRSIALSGVDKSGQESKPSR